MSASREVPVGLPVARFNDLVVTEATGEVLVYDTLAHHIHKLNVTTAAVWRLSDGTHDVSDIARLASLELGSSIDDATVRLALTQLDDAGLITGSLAAEYRVSRMTRRSFMQRSAIAGAAAVPALVSITAPANASFSEPICGEACIPGVNDCVQEGCTGCLNGTCVNDIVACTANNQGYPSVPCQNRTQCTVAIAAGLFEVPSGSNNYNCSGTGQVPGLGKGCCVGNQSANTASLTVFLRLPQSEGGTLVPGGAFSLAGPQNAISNDILGTGITFFAGLAAGSYTLTLTNEPLPGYTASPVNVNLAVGTNSVTIFLEAEAAPFARQSQQTVEEPTDEPTQEPTQVPPTEEPTQVPPTQVPPTQEPTQVPPTQVPPTQEPTPVPTQPPATEPPVVDTSTSTDGGETTTESGEG